MRNYYHKLLWGSLLSIFLSSTNCKREKTDSALMSKPKQGKLDLSWRSYLDPKKLDALNIDPVLNSNGDLLMSNFSARSEREPMMLFDGVTGELKWKWDDYFRDEEAFWGKCHTVNNDILVLCSHNATYALNILTGQTVWKHFSQDKYGSPFVFKDDKGYVYHSFHGDLGDNTNYIYRTKFDVMNWELVCIIKDSVNNKFERRYIDNMCFSYNSKGEQLVIYELWKANSLDDPNTVMACYNIDSKKYEWIKNYTDKFNNWGSPQMINDGTRIYTYIEYGSDYHLIAVNIANGIIEWDQNVPNYGVGLFMHNGTIISTCAIASPVICYNAKTGSIKWKQTLSSETLSENNFTFGSDCVKGNYLFSTQCNNILVLELNSGSIVYYNQTSFDDGCFQHGVVVNSQKGVFYVGDGMYANCIKLPEGVTF
jgi:outer membrane protein assembly factor BamB